jgi:hypothetical protein
VLGHELPDAVRHQHRGWIDRRTEVGSTGVITVTLSNDSKLGGATGGTLTLTPTTAAGNVISTWVCSGSPQKYMPGSCR